METRHVISGLLLLLVQQYVLTSPVWMPQFLSGGSGRNIRHLPCVSRRTGESGVCMFAISCLKSNGTHLGTCIDRFYFGSCCRLHDDGGHNNESNHLPVFPPSAPPGFHPGKPAYNKPITTEMTTTSKTHTTESMTKIEFVTKTPLKDDPVIKDPVKEPVITRRPPTTSSITKKPIKDDPQITKKPIIYEPITKKPLIYEPITKKPIKDEVITKKPTVVTRPVTEPTTTEMNYQLSTFQSVEDNANTVNVDRKTTTSSPRPAPTSAGGKPSEATTKPTKVSVKPTPSSTVKPKPSVKPPKTTPKPTLATTPKVTKATTTTPRSTTKPIKLVTTFSETTSKTTTPKPTSAPKPATTSTTTTTTRKPPTKKPLKKPSTTPSDGLASVSLITQTTPKPVKTTASKPPRPSSTPVPNDVEQPTTSGGLVTWTSVDVAATAASTTPKVVTTEATTATPSTTPKATTQKATTPKTTTPKTTTTTSTTTTAPKTTPKTTTTTTSTTTTPTPSTDGWVLIPDPTPPAQATLFTETTTASTAGSEELVDQSTEAEMAVTPGADVALNMSDFRDVCGRRLFPEARVVGGEKASFGKWPWQISLRQWRTSTYLHKCGAALLNENWAITAAHCVENVPPSDLLLRLGEHDLSTEEEPYGYQERRVQIVASHPQFDPRTFEYDLALLRFYEPVAFQPNILPVCVPQDDTSFVGKTATVTGWGRLYEDGPLPSVLQEVPVPVIKNEQCETMYRSAGYIEHIPNIFICAGWKKGGFDSCEGDSGGPMVIQRPDRRWLLAGVISWGIGCAEPNQPGVYTRISEFRDWINQILQF